LPAVPCGLAVEHEVPELMGCSEPVTVPRC
jgi:hypothetical protein